MSCSSLDVFGMKLRRTFCIPEGVLIEIIDDSAKPPKQMKTPKVRWCGSESGSYRLRSRWENVDSSAEDFIAPTSFPVRQTSANLPKSENRGHADVGHGDCDDLNRSTSSGFWEVDFDFASPPNVPKREVSLEVTHASKHRLTQAGLRASTKTQ
jgi:hypothetical protein